MGPLKKASEECGTAVATYFAAPQMENAIFVNKYAERFCNETKRNERFCPHAHARQDPVPLASLASDVAGESWVAVHDTYVWSDDNMAEIEKGYVLQADTVAELAEKAGLDPEVLQATVDAYNAAKFEPWC